MRAWRVILALVAAAVLGAALVGEPLAASPKQQLLDKQAQAQHVLSEVNALDTRFGATVEAYNGARYELAQTQQQLAADRASLRVAERQRNLALQHVSERVVALYESDPSPSTLSIFLGSHSLGEVIDALDTAHAVARADHRLAVKTTQVRNRYAAAVRSLKSTEQRREGAVLQRASERARIGSLLARRRQLLGSIESEVSALRVKEEQRQALLAAQAKARLAQEQELLRQQQLERAREAAAKAAATKTPAPATHRPRPQRRPTRTDYDDDGVQRSRRPAVVDPASERPPRCRDDRHALPRRAVPLGRFHPGRLRLLGPRDVRLQPARHRRSPTSPQLSTVKASRSRATSCSPAISSSSTRSTTSGIYIGGGQVVHAPSTGDVVKISNLSDWGASYVGARRI